MDAEFAPFLKTVIASLVYSLLGIFVFAVSFVVIKFLTPFSIRKEIEEDHNTALAIVIGSVILGISLIISAAIHG
jgi:putative membrane protein